MRQKRQKKMGKDKTLRNNGPCCEVGAPKFGINEVVYPRESAVKGFIEPITIAQIFLNRARNEYEYRFRKGAQPLQIVFIDGRPAPIPVPPSKLEDLSPVILLEHEMLTFCEAMDLVEAFLAREVVSAEAQFETVCGNEVPDTFESDPPPTRDFPFVLRPNEPKYSINEVVYLEETAQAVGRLEKMRIDDIRWDEDAGRWRYSAVFNQKPGENATVGDRNDLRRSVVVEKFEGELITVCEAIDLRVKFLRRTLAKVRRNRSARCETS
jgi:hypothetical protein